MHRGLGKRRSRLFAAAVLLAVTPGLAGAAAEGEGEKEKASKSPPSAETVLEQMEEASEPKGKMRADLAITATNREGEDVSWRGELFWRGQAGGAEGARRLVLDRPEDVKGVEYLVERATDGTDRVRLYLPELKRTRTVRTELQGESFLGTDFHYEDLGFDQLEFQTHEVIGRSDVDGKPCIQVQSTPDEPFGYGRILRCVDVEMHLPLRTEYFDRANQLWKVRTIEETEEMNGGVIPTRVVMEDMQAETRSVIELTNVRLDESLPDQAFTLLGTRSLEKGEKKATGQAKKEKKSGS